MSNFWLGFLNNFLPRTMGLNHPLRNRATIFVAVILANIAIALSAVFIIQFFLDAPASSKAVGFAIIGSICVFYTLALGALKLQASYSAASNIAAFTAYMAVIGGTVFTGGAESPAIQLFVVIPVLMFLLAGMKTGLLWSVLVLLTQAGIHIAGANGLGFMQLLQPADEAFLVHALPFFMSAMLIAALLIYERVTTHLQLQLQAERNRFNFKISRDALTDLPTSDEFHQRFKLALEDAARRHLKMALVFVSLDGYKPISESMGYQERDRILKIAATRMKEAIRHTDTAARLGGDKFAIVLHGIKTDADIEYIVQKVLCTIAIPIDLHGDYISITGSAGIAVYPSHGMDYELLSRLANDALLDAKQHQNTFRYATQGNDGEIVI